MTDELVFYMRLTMGFGPCNPRKWDILRLLDSPYSLFNDLWSIRQLLTPSEFNSLKYATEQRAQSMIDYCTKKNIHLLCYADKDYPQKLREIKDPPSILFVFGDIHSTDFLRAATIIGARQADEYSLRCTSSISGELAAHGVTIISGFAKGADSAAHIAAIENGGRTIAVLGCGVDYDYPKGSQSLKYKIKKNGAVISEYFPATRPAPENFRVRNRICSALSDCIICTQAAKRSGSLNTISHGIEQGKEIFVTPPHDIFSENYKGIISLLKDGAMQIYSASDVMELMNWDK